MHTILQTDQSKVPRGATRPLAIGSIEQGLL